MTDLYVLQDLEYLLVVATGTLYCYDLGDILIDSNPDQWKRVKKESGENVSLWGENVTSPFNVDYREGKLLSECAIDQS